MTSTNYKQMKKIEFIQPVYNLKDLPKRILPEVVLCGRSNVGKSSFINTLFNQKIAQTSSTPGKTRSLNYYLVDNKFYLVDLPGFGYAKVSKTERDKWQRIIETYFASERNIVLAFHLIDSRHDPMPLDISLNAFLRELNLPYIAVMSKIDKLKQSEIAASRRRMIEFFPELIFGENLLHFSAVKGTGKKEVLSRFSNLFG